VQLHARLQVGQRAQQRVEGAQVEGVGEALDDGLGAVGVGACVRGWAGRMEGAEVEGVGEALDDGLGVGWGWGWGWGRGEGRMEGGVLRVRRWWRAV
jgi:hypothetical protein